MENSTRVGMNRTGLDMAPLSKGTLVAFAEQQASRGSPDVAGIADIREQYTQEADRVGSVPVPSSLKGMAATMVDKIKGNKPEVLLDKMGERLAYERTGVRLYEALMLKVVVADGSTVVDMAQLASIRDDEAAHVHLLAECLRELGADPTAMTPGADVSGVAGLGHLQVLADPRTTVPQALNSILMIELGDNAAWDLLAEVARESGHAQMAERFTAALETESRHLKTVQGWLRQAVLQEAA